MLYKTDSMTRINEGIHFCLRLLSLKLTIMVNAHLPFLISVFMHKCNLKAHAQNLHEVQKYEEFLRPEPSKLMLR